jgi:hypothetical protein
MKWARLESMIALLTSLRSAVLMTLVSLALAGATVAAELPESGAAVPDFTLPTLDGGSRTLSERSAEGPVVLVFFRGVW